MASLEPTASEGGPPSVHVSRFSFRKHLLGARLGFANNEANVGTMHPVKILLSLRDIRRSVLLLINGK
jgi:hypothetical protein